MASSPSPLAPYKRTNYSVHGRSDGRYGDAIGGQSLRSGGEKQQLQASVYHTPAPLPVAPLLRASPSPQSPNAWSTSKRAVVGVSSFPSTPTKLCSRSRTRKVAKVRQTNSKAVSETNVPSHSDFSSDSLEELTTSKPSDIRSLSYYQHVPIKLEDLLSDIEGEEKEGLEQELGGKEGVMMGLRGMIEVGDNIRSELAHPLGFTQADNMCEGGASKGIRVADEFYRRSLLRGGMKALVKNVLIKREVTRMTVWHHQQRKLKLLFLKVSQGIISHYKDITELMCTFTCVCCYSGRKQLQLKGENNRLSSPLGEHGQHCNLSM